MSTFPTPATIVKSRFQGGLRLYYQNVRGLNSKIRDVYNFTTSQFKPFGLIALTETWLDGGVCSGELFPAAYAVFRADRRRSEVGLSRGGGVLLAVDSSLSAHSLNLYISCPRL